MAAGQRARTLTLLATSLGSSLAFLDTTAVVVALPRMDEDLHLGLAGEQWVYLAYGLTLAACYLVGGAVGDRFGLRRTFVAGVVFFAAASLVTALAPEEGMLLAGRALQGVGGAVLTTTSLALLRVTWADEAGRAIGLWTSLTSVAAIAGPPFGGLVVEAASWRWVFLINIPLAVVTIGLALAGRGGGRESCPRTRFDLVGAALVAVGLTCISYAIVELREQGLQHVLPVLAVGLLALGGLAAWTQRATDPLVPAALFREPGLVAANLVVLVLYGALGAHILFVPVYLQFFGFSPVVAGLVFVPPAVALVLLAPYAGRYADRHGPRAPVTVGSLVIVLAMLLMLPVTERQAVWTWGVASILVFSIGLACVVAPITAAAISPAPASLAGVASGFNQTVARIGNVLSVAVIGAVAAVVFTAGGGVGDNPFAPTLEGATRAAGVSAFQATVLGMAALCLVSALLAATLLPAARGQRMTPSRRNSVSLRSSPPP